MDEINTLLVVSVNCRTINNVEIFGQWLMYAITSSNSPYNYTDWSDDKQIIKYCALRYRYSREELSNNLVLYK